MISCESQKPLCWKLKLFTNRKSLLVMQSKDEKPHCTADHPHSVSSSLSLLSKQISSSISYGRSGISPQYVSMCHLGSALFFLQYT